MTSHIRDWRTVEAGLASPIERERYDEEAHRRYYGRSFLELERQNSQGYLAKFARMFRSSLVRLWEYEPHVSDIEPKPQIMEIRLQQDNRAFLRESQVRPPGEVWESEAIRKHTARQQILQTLRNYQNGRERYLYESGAFSIAHSPDVFIFAFRYWDAKSCSIRVDPHHEPDAYRVLIIMKLQELEGLPQLRREFDRRGLATELARLKKKISRTKSGGMQETE